MHAWSDKEWHNNTCNSCRSSNSIYKRFNTHWHDWSAGLVTSLDGSVRAPTRRLLARSGTSSTPPVTRKIAVSGVGFFSTTVVPSLLSWLSSSITFVTLSPLDNLLTNLVFFGLRLCSPLPPKSTSCLTFRSILYLLRSGDFLCGLLTYFIFGSFSKFDGFMFSLLGESSLESSSPFTLGKVSEDFSLCFWAPFNLVKISLSVQPWNNLLHIEYIFENVLQYLITLLLTIDLEKLSPIFRGFLHIAPPGPGLPHGPSMAC